MMADDLTAHWTLHEIDEEAARHEVERAKLPEQRRLLETRITTEKRRVDAATKRAGELLARRRELERELATLEAHEKKYRAQLDAVTNQHQFEAVQHEIAGVVAKRSDLETEALTVMENEDRVATERPAVDTALAKAEHEGAATFARLDAEGARLAALVAGLDARRSETVALLAAPARARYERARALRGGRAVSELVNGSCGGCFSGQAPHALQEARKREQLLVCDACGRLLMLRPE
jgi:predicted  nucleic acid-binding Zn-ribbon protein